ncbi:hypothetical protein HMPREF1316_1395 [Olsenella profusa F0195]|uniref:Uncharacterized protein n=1 Tax=Olsenella profusa F0195 TaxID=1125712 RepID=U2V3P5_9ACTN|nr:hypothetical protein HMPREF1316_1395 [Olsenella profusa F0195]
MRDVWGVAWDARRGGPAPCLRSDGTGWGTAHGRDRGLPAAWGLLVLMR